MPHTDEAVKTVVDEGQKYAGYSGLRQMQLDPTIEGSAVRWNQSRLRRAGRALLSLLPGKEGLYAQMDADQTAALRERILDGPAHQTASAREVAGSQPELPVSAIAQETVPQAPVEAPIEPPKPGGPEQ